MKVLSICKTVKKKHKSKKKWKKRNFNKSFTKKFTTTFALDKIQLVFSEMSGNCFWYNYYNAFQWRNNYLDFWRVSTNSPQTVSANRKEKTETMISNKNQDSCTNDVQDCIRDLNGITLGSVQKIATHSQSSSHNMDCNDDGNSSDSSSSLEVSEEMIKFMEINMRHRANLEAEKKRLRELRKQVDENYEVLERDNIDECKTPAEASLNVSRKAEMTQLYGKSAPMIHGMETAIQLTFNWNCDHHKPEYWPILPFTFKFAKN